MDAPAINEVGFFSCIAQKKDRVYNWNNKDLLSNISEAKPILNVLYPPIPVDAPTLKCEFNFKCKYKSYEGDTFE